MTWGIFVSDERGLAELARGGLLDGVSKRVYRGGVEYLLRVSPAGAVRARATVTWWRKGALRCRVVRRPAQHDDQAGARLAREYTAGTAYNHTPKQVTGFFVGLELVGPGLAGARHWDPKLSSAPLDRRAGRILAGAGRKPREPLPRSEQHR